MDGWHKVEIPPTHLDGDQGGGTDVEMVDEVVVEVTEVGVEHSEAGDVARGRAAGRLVSYPSR